MRIVGAIIAGLAGAYQAAELLWSVLPHSQKARALRLLSNAAERVGTLFIDLSEWATKGANYHAQLHAAERQQQDAGGDEHGA